MNNKKRAVLFIVGVKNFRDEEYFQPRVILQANGFEVITAADTTEEEATGAKGGKARIDVKLNRVKPTNYEAIVFVGGSGATNYFQDQTAHKLVTAFLEAKKVVGAICIAPSILANAKALINKKATSFATQKDNLMAKGADFVDQGVVVDQNIITAQGPEVAADFGKAIVAALNQS